MLDRRDEPDQSPGIPTEGLDPSAASPAKPVRPNEEARASLARWLSTRRVERNMTLDDIARITKIQPRILERLESGQLDGLPADVFVRGFVRSFAKSIGLDEDEALKRYAACGQHAPAPVAAAARAMVDAMIDLAPLTARTGVRSTQELPVVAPPVETIETVMLPATGTLVVEKPVEAAPPVPEPIAEPAPVAEAAEAVETKPSKKKRRGGKRRNKRADMAVGTPAQASPTITAELAASESTDASAASTDLAPASIDEAPSTSTEDVAMVSASASTEDAPAVDAPSTDAPADAPAVDAPAASADVAITDETIPSAALTSTASISMSMPTATAVEIADAQPVEPAIGASVDDVDEPIVTQPWRPKMPPLASAGVPPWKISRPSSAQGPVVPSLVIDDADPDSAERERDERAAQRDGKEPRRSFLPPILLDREDRSARQGGLTLAVIILLIAATITLSYLMRRPSSSGDGVTVAAPPATLIG